MYWLLLKNSIAVELNGNGIDFTRITPKYADKALITPKLWMKLNKIAYENVGRFTYTIILNRKRIEFNGFVIACATKSHCKWNFGFILHINGIVFKEKMAFRLLWRNTSIFTYNHCDLFAFIQEIIPFENMRSFCYHRVCFLSHLGIMWKIDTNYGTSWKYFLDSLNNFDIYTGRQKINPPTSSVTYIVV